MPGQVAIATKAMLDHLPPGSAPSVVAAQGRQCHSQVAGWETAKFSAQPPAGPAIIGNTDDGRDLIGHPAQCLEGGR